jgi:hypothetical protein
LKAVFKEAIESTDGMDLEKIARITLKEVGTHFENPTPTP